MPGMNRDAIEDLYSFTDFIWREIGEAIAAGGGDALLTRPAPGSGWPALRDCLAHMLLAYERWLADRQESATVDHRSVDSFPVLPYNFH